MNKNNNSYNSFQSVSACIQLQIKPHFFVEIIYLLQSYNVIYQLIVVKYELTY